MYMYFVVVKDLGQVVACCTTVIAIDVIIILRLMFTILSFVDLWYIQREIKVHLLITTVTWLVCVPAVCLAQTYGSGHKGTIQGQPDSDILWNNYNVVTVIIQLSLIAMMFTSGVLVIRWNESRFYVIRQRLLTISQLPNSSASAISMSTPMSPDVVDAPFPERLTSSEILVNGSSSINNPNDPTISEDKANALLAHASTEAKKTPATIDVNKAPLLNLLENAKGYEAFMIHLTREFSIENLLLLTELAQLQEILIEFEYLEKHEPEFHLTNIRIPKNIDIPLSPSLVRLRTVLSSENCSSSNPNRYNLLFPAWVYIYKKYIDGKNAPYMVNLSSVVRVEVTRFYNCIDKWMSQSAPNRRTIFKRFHGLSEAVIIINREKNEEKKEPQLPRPQDNKNDARPWFESEGMKKENFLLLVKAVRNAAKEIFDLMKDSHTRFQFQRAVVVTKT
ncbi:hypothetical protein RFI_05528 [Reticulomyxa filosa]|uniref:RGS domain-containing protein n=1 Tax=Reticulomyxa filosa TaxID=46433 RepID=X6P0C1_RETFI|nr:hypothetical protein RFI_05528 [Reticulomyxa filosa]|eukprot:ETO31588.1 hypothetical protein RFI_05528 [Reticulomyxa filosa]